MASAYGVEALVERLVQAGADTNTRNSLSWTPLQVRPPPATSILMDYIN